MSASRVSVDRLLAWREAEATKADGSLFMRLPDSWWDDPHWFCGNGHVSGRFLKSEERGSLCLACKTPVVLGPAIGEAAFASVLLELANLQ